MSDSIVMKTMKTEKGSFMLSKIKDRLHAERFHYTNGMATDFSVPTPKPENSGMLSGMLGENNGQLRIEYSNYLTRKR